MLTLLLVLGYIFGSVPFSYLIGRCYGVDVREVGARAASPGNVWRGIGRVPGAVAFVAEVTKGAFPMLMARALLGDDLAVLLVGLAAMVGHNWPVFLGFDGGRGVSLGLATLLLVSYQWLGLAMIPLIVLTVALRDSAPAVLATFLLVPVFATAMGFSQPVAIASAGIPAITILRRVTAPSLSNVASEDRLRVLLNRLIFDRNERFRS